MPFREESCRSSCIYSSPLHSYSRDAVSQHPSTRTGVESIQLIYSGRELQALSDLVRQFQCHPIFWREFPVSVTFVGFIVIIIAFVVILSPFPLPIPSPTTLGPTIPESSFPVEDHWLKIIWLGLPPSIIMGARWRTLRLARGSAESVCLRAHCYLHHAHTRPRTLITPLNATTLHTSLPRAPRPHPCTP